MAHLVQEWYAAVLLCPVLSRQLLGCAQSGQLSHTSTLSLPGSLS